MAHEVQIMATIGTYPLVTREPRLDRFGVWQTRCPQCPYITPPASSPGTPNSDMAVHVTQEHNVVGADPWRFGSN
ncbi:hypothetical protein [Micromonospora sp. NPDC005652]|uniref:hypothetical protein n=1 Tax=Micromonospora sp. NPDC005652 TaxID=3157046 RepID=UPI0033D91D06